MAQTDDGWAKWFREQFDKLMLFVMFTGQVLLVVWMIRHVMEVGYVNWAQNIASTILGTLLGLITGKLLSKTDQSVQATAPSATTQIIQQTPQPKPGTTLVEGGPVQDVPPQQEGQT